MVGWSWNGTEHVYNMMWWIQTAVQILMRCGLKQWFCWLWRLGRASWRERLRMMFMLTMTMMMMLLAGWLADDDDDAGEYSGRNVYISFTVCGCGRVVWRMRWYLIWWNALKWITIACDCHSTDHQIAIGLTYTFYSGGQRSAVSYSRKMLM